MIVGWLARQLRAAAALAALAPSIAPVEIAVAQTTETSVTAELAKKKAAMLEMFLASKRLSSVLLLRPETAAPLVESARVHLDSGWDMLDASDPVGAAAQFDKGIGAVSAAIALAGKGTATSESAQVRANANRQREVRSYLEVLNRAEGLTDEDRQRVTEMRERLAEANTRIAAGDQQAATVIVNDLYPQVVALVSRVQRGQTAFVSKTFDTPEEAFEYERARNDNHRLLVELALAERAEFQPGLNNLAANLSTLSDQLRAEAEEHAAAGRIVEAVERMQRANERLSAILRAAGLIVSGADSRQ